MGYCISKRWCPQSIFIQLKISIQYGFPEPTRILSDKPSQWIVFISGPVSSIPSSVSNEIPDDVMLKGKARGGDTGDFASLMNLFPARENKSLKSVIGGNGSGFQVWLSH